MQKLNLHARWLAGRAVSNESAGSELPGVASCANVQQRSRGSHASSRNCAAFEQDGRRTSDFLYTLANSPTLESGIFPGKSGVAEEGDMESLELESFEGRRAPMTRGFAVLALLMGCRPTSACAKPLLRRQGTTCISEQPSHRGCWWMLAIVEPASPGDLCSFPRCWTDGRPPRTATTAPAALL